MMFLMIVLLAVSVLFGLYMWYPPFGGRSPKKTFRSSKNYNRNKFRNTPPTALRLDSKELLPFLRRIARRANAQPAKPLTMQKPDFDAFRTGRGLQLIWLGHSTVLARIGGQTILFDPVFGKRVSPFSWVGPKRFAFTSQLAIEDLPPIDAVVISHDHYDHLDYYSIKRLKSKTKRFFVPLGVGSHLRRWGIAEDSITELDWWQESVYNGLTIACTPAQHFSGRGLHDRDATLWSSWVVQSTSDRLFFSGDGGYGAHFKQIGKRYGPFTATLLECGQYDPLWPKIHMTPEQTVQAHIDLGGKIMLPIHWGAFALAPHAWTNPAERVVIAATKAKCTAILPRIGENVDAAQLPVGHAAKAWWRP